MATLPLIEPVPVDDDLITGLAVIEEVDCGVRLVLYVDQTCYEAGAPTLTQHVIKRKLVMALPALEAVNKTVRAFLARRSAAQGRLKVVS